MSATQNRVMVCFNLAPRRIGGIETMCRQLALQLSSAGYEIVFVFRSDPPPHVAEFLDTGNVRFEVLCNPGRASITGCRELARLIRKYRPEVVHLNFFDFFGPHAWLAKACGVRRVIFTDHISRDEDQTLRQSSWLRRRGYRLCVPVDRILCVSEFVRRCWTETGRFPADRVTTVYNGVDIDRCQAGHAQAKQFRRSLGINEKAIVVTQVSSLIPEKGFQTFLESARIVNESTPVLFLVVGDGMERKRYESWVTDNGLQDIVHFTGLVSDPVGEGLFAASDIVVQVSNWQEAFGLVLAEAMATGIPVIGTDVGGIPELIENGSNGYVVPKRDAPRLADRILEFVADPRRRERFGTSGTERSRSLFQHTENARATIELYQLGSTMPAMAGSL